MSLKRMKLLHVSHIDSCRGSIGDVLMVPEPYASRWAAEKSAVVVPGTVPLQRDGEPLAEKPEPKVEPIIDCTPDEVDVQKDEPENNAKPAPVDPDPPKPVRRKKAST